MRTAPRSLIRASFVVRVSVYKLYSDASLDGIRGGVYLVCTPSEAVVYRAWAPGTAPPAAPNEALIVSGSSIVRGQPGRHLVNLVTNPWVGLAGRKAS